MLVTIRETCDSMAAGRSFALSNPLISCLCLPIYMLQSIIYENVVLCRMHVTSVSAHEYQHVLNLVSAWCWEIYTHHVVNKTMKLDKLMSVSSVSRLYCGVCYPALMCACTIWKHKLEQKIRQKIIGVPSIWIFMKMIFYSLWHDKENVLQMHTYWWQW